MNFLNNKWFKVRRSFFFTAREKFKKGNFSICWRKFEQKNFSMVSSEVIDPWMHKKKLWNSKKLQIRNYKSIKGKISPTQSQIWNKFCFFPKNWEEKVMNCMKMINNTKIDQISSRQLLSQLTFKNATHLSFSGSQDVSSRSNKNKEN
jgi:hypothetical protein